MEDCDLISKSFVFKIASDFNPCKQLFEFNNKIHKVAILSCQE